MSPKFQERSALKLAGWIISCTKHRGISRKSEATWDLRLAENEWSEAWSVSRINETQILQTQCSNICKLNYPAAGGGYQRYLWYHYRKAGYYTYSLLFPWLLGHICSICGMQEVTAKMLKIYFLKRAVFFYFFSFINFRVCLRESWPFAEGMNRGQINISSRFFFAIIMAW